MPSKERQPDENFPLKLTVKQRESLVHTTRLTRRLKSRIKETTSDQLFIEFTKKELAKMGDEIPISLAFAPPAHSKRLKTVLDEIADLLDDLSEKDLKEQR